SDNLEHISNPEPLRKLLRRLAHEQRVLSRKTRGSHRYEKQRIKVAELHQRIRDFRNDFLQKLSTDLIRKYSIIGIEDLDVKHLLREGDTDTARRISDAGWNSFVSMLQYKADWYKRKLVKVGRYFPSSQICHDCGYQFPDVKTKRLITWTCPKCGKVHQRDENASLNIRDEALRILAGVSV
ncbi:MAG: transposase, partial [Lachnospiraceae bacterium]|nr:transposase [Lachnospiraceae bacterium]